MSKYIIRKYFCRVCNEKLQERENTYICLSEYSSASGISSRTGFSWYFVFEILLKFIDTFQFGLKSDSIGYLT
jgi:hypothetical protein